jgi:hypothetical protein
VVSRDNDNRHAGQRTLEATEFLHGMQDGGIGGPNSMKEVAGHYDRVGTNGYDAVDGPAERGGDVDFALIAAALGQTMVLPESEVRICEVR